jgi:hypothetical protein
LYNFYTPFGYEDSEGKDNLNFNPSLPLTFSFSIRSFGEVAFGHTTLKPRHSFRMPSFANAPAGNRSTNGKQTSKGLFIFNSRYSGIYLLDYQRSFFFLFYGKIER